jgi:cytochrome bd-type quinol oxidase subunit 1
MGVKGMTSWTEEQSMNPLVPTALDGALMAVSLVALILALAAFVSLIRAGSPAGWPLLAWVLVVLLVPFVGPAAWFTVRRRERSSDPQRRGESA